MGNINDYQEKLIKILRNLKTGDVEELSNRFLIYNRETLIGYLKPVSSSWIFKDRFIDLLSKWREENWFAYPTVFKVTLEGTKKWVKEQLIERPDRILFMIFNRDEQLIGHLGLSNFNFEKKEAEIDNVVRGVKNISPGIMTFAMNTLIDWSFFELGLERLFLRVFYDNSRAIKLYERCGFQGIQKIPLRKKTEGDVVKYEEIVPTDMSPPDRVFYLMELLKKITIKEYYKK